MQPQSVRLLNNVSHMQRGMVLRQLFRGGAPAAAAATTRCRCGTLALDAPLNLWNRTHVHKHRDHHGECGKVPAHPMAPRRLAERG
jgi:hypothetical protein